MTTDSGRPAPFQPGTVYVSPDDPRFTEVLRELMPRGFADEQDAQHAARVCAVIVGDPQPEPLGACSKYTRMTAPFTVRYQTAGLPAITFHGLIVCDEYVEAETDLLLFHDGLHLRLDELSGCDGLPPHLTVFIEAVKPRITKEFFKIQFSYMLDTALGSYQTRLPHPFSEQDGCSVPPYRSSMYFRSLNVDDPGYLEELERMLFAVPPVAVEPDYDLWAIGPDGKAVSYPVIMTDGVG